MEKFVVGDIVVATCDHPESNEVLMRGDMGRVVYAGTEEGILVDWFVTPDPKQFHNGNSGQIKLDQYTGWWIWNTDTIERVEEKMDFPALDGAEIDTFFS